MASTTLVISADFAKTLRQQGQNEMAAGMANLHAMKNHTVAAGKLADLLVIHGDPLEDLGALRNVALVIQDGEIVVAD